MALLPRSHPKGPRVAAFLFVTLAGACQHDMMGGRSPTLIDVPPPGRELAPASHNVDAAVANGTDSDAGSAARHVIDVELEAKPADVELAPGHVVHMWTYNGVVPGPRIEAHVGDTVRVHLTNSLPESTTIHWHGLRVPNAMDGAPAVQREIEPGASFTYEFALPDSGTFWYHPHMHSDVQIERGLYGAIVVHGDDEPVVDGDHVMVMDDVLLDSSWQIESGTSMMQAMTGREGNLLLASGYANPTIAVPAGSLQRFRFINTANARYFRLALAGHELIQIGADGALFEKPETKRDVLVVPGQRVDVLVQLGNQEAGSLTWQTLPYERGHGVDGGPAHDVFQLSLSDALPKAAPLPNTLAQVPELPHATVRRELKMQEQMMGSGMGMSNGSMGPTFSFNGQVYPKITPLDARAGNVEEWSLINESAMDHPFHLHGFRFQVVHGAGVEPTRRALRDTIDVPAGETVRIRLRIDDQRGAWMYHCHILEHAERGMMGELRVSD